MARSVGQFSSNVEQTLSDSLQDVDENAVHLCELSDGRETL